MVSVAALLALENCQPDCFDHVAGDKVEDPLNCTQFYLCVYDGQPSDDTVACGPGDIFDAAIGECVPGSSCQPSCVPTKCDSKCTGIEDFIQDPLNCNAYYLCIIGQNIEGPYYCPPDRPYFDGNHCISDDSRCCDNLCLPYCHPGDVQIIDPKDCSQYYLCTEEGPASENTHFPCPSGETFQISSGKCQPDVACVILCP